MKTIIKACIGVTIISVLLSLSGCGTTVKETNTDNTAKEPVIPGITNVLNSEEMQLVDNPYPEKDYITCKNFAVSEPNALIEVYTSALYEAGSLVGVTNANENGVFEVTITNPSDDVDNRVFYVTQIAPGMRRSAPVLITK